MAPSTSATGQLRPGTSVCATAAATSALAMTRPTARDPTLAIFARSVRSGVKADAMYTIGGSTSTKMTSGATSIWGTRGTRPRASPPDQEDRVGDAQATSDGDKHSHRDQQGEDEFGRSHFFLILYSRCDAGRSVVNSGEPEALALGVCSDVRRRRSLPQRAVADAICPPIAWELVSDCRPEPQLAAAGRRRLVAPRRPMLPFLLLGIAAVLGDPALSRLNGLFVVGPPHTFSQPSHQRGRCADNDWPA